jgi:hypothetical protein
MAEDIIDDVGEPRKLGTLPILPGFTTSIKAYADSGKPMFTKAELIANAESRDTRGRTKFDPSWIMDQKSHGSCNGFAEAAAGSRSRVRRGLKKILLSGAYAYSLMNGGHDDGSVLKDGMERSQITGIATADTVPWDAIYPSRYDRAKADAEAARFKMAECYTLMSELEYFSALAANFDVVQAVHVGNTFQRLNTNGIAGSDRGQGNHSTSADGYTVVNGELAADMVNSWNLSFGEQGRCWITWARHLAQTVQYHGFYAIRTAIDDPSGTNPPPIN